MSKQHWSVDSLVYRNHTLFGFGWAFHEEKIICDIKLIVKSPDGSLESIPATFGSSRDDVSHHYSDFKSALHSGFLLYGTCVKDVDANSVFSLLVAYEDQSSEMLSISQTAIISLGQGAENALPLFRQFWFFAKRGLSLARQLKFRLLFEKIGRYARNRPTGNLAGVPEAVKLLESQIKQASILIIDHDLGGGANHYRERLVSEKILEGKTVYIFSFHVATLSYVVMVRTGTSSNTFSIPGYSFLFELAGLLNVEELIYNTGVSFAKSEELPQLMIDLRSKLDIKLTVLVHDFFMVCPSHFLLNYAGNYCGIPSLEMCQSCLVKNNHGFTSLFQARDMRQWRALWGTVLSNADEIRTFSNNTLTLLREAYPSIELSRTVVQPHSVDYIESIAVEPTQTDELRIGVVGQIGSHKGAKVVQQLSEEIKRQGLSVKVVIIGTIEASCDTAVVSQTGHYKHDDLPSLIRSAGVNVMLFPSIWPETFSYVVQELIELDLPVACFDLGAPSERLALYEKGLVLKSFEIPSVLDELVRFHQRVYFVKEFSK